MRLDGILWELPSGKRLHKHGKSQCLLGKLLINGHSQQLCVITRGYSSIWKAYICIYIYNFRVVISPDWWFQGIIACRHQKMNLIDTFIVMCVCEHIKYSYPYSIDCKYLPAVKCGNGKSPINTPEDTLTAMENVGNLES